MYVVKARKTGGCTVLTCPFVTAGDYYDISVEEDGSIRYTPVGHSTKQEVDE